jgi:hypothetical protein
MTLDGRIPSVSVTYEDCSPNGSRDIYPITLPLLLGVLARSIISSIIGHACKPSDRHTAELVQVLSENALQRAVGRELGKHDFAE